MVRAIERVTGAGRVQVTIAGGPAGRRVCILIDEPSRFYELDQGLTAGDFPVLAKAGFQAAPAPMLQTMSIYRSLAKSAMGYSADAGDRIIVLLCPKAAWQEVRHPWPDDSSTSSP